MDNERILLLKKKIDDIRSKSNNMEDVLIINLINSKIDKDYLFILRGLELNVCYHESIYFSCLSTSKYKVCEPILKKLGFTEIRPHLFEYKL